VLVEHSFVTILEADEALGAARTLLGQLGFHAEQSADPNVRDFRRGLSKAARARRISELPQRVHLEYDRGRVTLAASIEVVRKDHALHRALLLALAESVELVVGRGDSIDQAGGRWDEVHREIEKHAAARRRRGRILIAVLTLVIVILLVLAIWLATFDL
jgi:hypothetical protein